MGPRRGAPSTTWAANAVDPREPLGGVLRRPAPMRRVLVGRPAAPDSQPELGGASLVTSSSASVPSGCRRARPGTRCRGAGRPPTRPATRVVASTTQTSRVSRLSAQSRPGRRCACPARRARSARRLLEDQDVLGDWVPSRCRHTWWAGRPRRAPCRRIRRDPRSTRRRSSCAGPVGRSAPGTDRGSAARRPRHPHGRPSRRGAGSSGLTWVSPSSTYPDSSASSLTSSRTWVGRPPPRASGA